MTGRSTQVCPKTESTVFKVWVIVCSVDSFCHFVPFRFFFLFASWMETVVIKLWSVCPRQVLASRVFFCTSDLSVHSGQASVSARAQMRVCMDTYIGICRSEVSVYRRAFFSGCSTVFDGFTTM